MGRERTEVFSRISHFRRRLAEPEQSALTGASVFLQALNPPVETILEEAKVLATSSNEGRECVDHIWQLLRRLADYRAESEVAEYQKLTLAVLNQLRATTPDPDNAWQVLDVIEVLVCGAQNATSFYGKNGSLLRDPLLENVEDVKALRKYSAEQVFASYPANGFEIEAARKAFFASKRLRQHGDMNTRDILVRSVLNSEDILTILNLAELQRQATVESGKRPAREYLDSAQKVADLSSREAIDPEQALEVLMQGSLVYLNPQQMRSRSKEAWRRWYYQAKETDLPEALREQPAPDDLLSQLHEKTAINEDQLAGFLKAVALSTQ